MTEMTSGPPVAPPTRTQGTVQPDRLYVNVSGLSSSQSRILSRQAVRLAQRMAPKLSGQGSRGIDTYYGTGFFGIRWRSPYLWYQERGIRPFTMRSLAGKTIPMWVDDPTGQQARSMKNPKTRITASGRRQVLIFRRAAPIGARKTTVRRDPQTGRMIVRDVPQSYPGAPGRITLRQYLDYGDGTNGTNGKIATMKSQPNIGVRWRHPGIHGRHFLNEAIVITCLNNNLGRLQVQATYRRR